MVFYGQQILKAQTQMRAAFSDINKDCRATLYVGISRFRANAFFPLIWKLYHPSHPNISIELVSEKLLCCFSETLLETCCQISRNGDSLSILSPTIFYQHRYDREAEDPRFHIRPIRNDIPENTVYLVFRRNQTLPRYAADFIQDASMVFRNYARSIKKNYT